MTRPSKIRPHHSDFSVGVTAEQVKDDLRQITYTERNPSGLRAASVASVYVSSITTFERNTRTIPFPLEVFVTLDWPDAKSPTLDDQILALLEKNKDKLHPRFKNIKKAAEFISEVYTLASTIDYSIQLQHIGVIEFSDNVYSLLYGQRRFMAIFLLKRQLINAALYDPEVKSKGYVEYLQDVENDQRSNHTLYDYVVSKRSMYTKGMALYPTNKSALFRFMGIVSRAHGYALINLYERADEDQVMELIADDTIITLNALDLWIKDNPDGELTKKPSRAGIGRVQSRLSKHGLVSLERGKGVDLSLLQHLAKLYIEANSEDIDIDLDSEDGLSELKSLTSAFSMIISHYENKK